MEPLLWTRHASDKLYYLGLSPSQAETALSYGTRIPEGNNKFKIVCRIKNALLIAVCREDELGVWVITVVRKRG
ncbi:hypothetical protein HY994_04915 [Candidatus Micrarchaeota archaeon]|nr:hypothetical protein [Candidatus Micrarchaeota archaeon]